MIPANPAGPMTPQAAQTTARIVWLALTLSILLFGVVLIVAVRGEPANPGGEFVATLLLIAVALAFGAIVLRRLTFGDVGLRRAAERAAERPARESAFLLGMQNQLVICLALHETVALLGFVLAFVAREPRLARPFIAAALVLNALAFPQPLRWLERARELLAQTGTTLACVLALTACSFRGGDYAPLAKEPETPCSRQAEEFCKENLAPRTTPRA
jgi:F0F1-type ATP synthase membrane subunit c/vacuolar-type H+-ATPase subunit K